MLVRLCWLLDLLQAHRRVSLLPSARDLPTDLAVGPKAIWGLLSVTQVLSFRTLALGTRRRRGGRKRVL